MTAKTSTTAPASITTIAADPDTPVTFQYIQQLVNQAIDKLDDQINLIDRRWDEHVGFLHIGGHHFRLTGRQNNRKVYGKYAHSYWYVLVDDQNDPITATYVPYSGMTIRRKKDFARYLLQGILTVLGMEFHVTFRNRHDVVMPGPRPEPSPVPDALPPVAAIISPRDTPPTHTTAYQDTRSRQTGVPVEQLEKEMAEAMDRTDADYHDPIGRLARYMDRRREAGLDSRELAEELLTAMGLAKGGPLHLVNLLDKYGDKD